MALRSLPIPSPECRSDPSFSHIRQDISGSLQGLPFFCFFGKAVFHRVSHRRFARHLRSYPTVYAIFIRDVCSIHSDAYYLHILPIRELFERFTIIILRNNVFSILLHIPSKPMILAPPGYAVSPKPSSARIFPSPLDSRRKPCYNRWDKARPRRCIPYERIQISQ